MFILITIEAITSTNYGGTCLCIFIRWSSQKVPFTIYNACYFLHIINEREEEKGRRSLIMCLQEVRRVRYYASARANVYLQKSWFTCATFIMNDYLEQAQLHALIHMSHDRLGHREEHK